MATTGQILSNITMGANQAIRRNAGDTGFETFAPHFSSISDVRHYLNFI